MSPTANSESESKPKEFADPYEESYEELSPDEVTKSILQYATVDMTYKTHRGNTKTVRSIKASEPYDGSDLTDADGCVTFYDSGNGDSYAFHVETQRLISRNKQSQNRTVATAEDFQQFRKVDYPDPAPVKGGIEEGVDATIYYRSPLSDRMQTVTIAVDSIEGGVAYYRIVGYEVNGDRRIEALTSYDRELRKVPSGTSLGKVARVEFPKGHQFTIELEGMTTDQVEDAPERIKNLVESKYNKYSRQNEAITATVTHDGQTTYNTEINRSDEQGGDA